MTNWHEINLYLRQLWEETFPDYQKGSYDAYDPASALTYLQRVIEYLRIQSVQPKIINKLEDFTPVQIQRRLYTFLVTTDICDICGKEMMMLSGLNLFPARAHITQLEQMHRVGIVERWGKTEAGQNICVECSQAGLATFTCCFCRKQYSLSELHSKLYENELVCKTCYLKTPHAEWEKKLDALRNRHRWDYE